jgi:predicted metal-dependent phosphoesterase TrpH
MELKADLHLHTREGERFVEHDARGLIDRAAGLGFDVLSITDHDRLTFDADLAAYASARGVLLIPGVEATIEGAHVLVYNLDVAPARLRTFADLRRLRGGDWLVTAPHPYFPASFALQGRLVQEIDLFDAVELSHFYTRWIDFNRPAVRLAMETGLPLIGTSDSHLVRQLGTTYSVIDADPTVASVLKAIRKGQIRVVSRPLTVREFATIAARMLAGDYRERVARRFRKKESGHAR